MTNDWDIDPPHPNKKIEAYIVLSVILNCVSVINTEFSKSCMQTEDQNKLDFKTY